MSLFEDELVRDPAYSLTNAFDVIWDNYEDDFRGYWGLDDNNCPDYIDEDEWREYIDLSRLVTRLANGARSLVRPVKTPDRELTLYDWLSEEATQHEQGFSEILEKIRESVSRSDWWDLYLATRPSKPSDPRLKKLFMDACMELEASRIFPYSPSFLATRLFKLLNHIVRRPGQRCREYLPRVAECYVRGMDLELAVMARTVLEAALHDEYSDEYVDREVGAGGFVTLERRIQCAAKAGPFREQKILEAADSIRETGNRVAHGDIDIVVDPDAVLEDLSISLAALDSFADQ